MISKKSRAAAKKRNWMLLLLVPIFLSLSLPQRAFCYKKKNNGPAIVSPSYPKDSRGETVYEIQGDKQRNEPIVPGTLSNPSLVRWSSTRYPSSLLKSHPRGTVTISGVVATNGDFIDPQVIDSPIAEFSQSALEAVKQYVFRPATLDGRPVAMFTHIEIHFEIN